MAPGYPPALPGASIPGGPLTDLRNRLRMAAGALDTLLAALADRYWPDLDAAYQRLAAGIGQSPDVLLRWLAVPAVTPARVLLAAVDGLADTRTLDQDVIAPLLRTHHPPAEWGERVLIPARITRETTWSGL
ncbi:MAG: hypothetical protein OWV35_11860, partial [Firmicutes bacterium]|nr:hypothetical protein [Bacillota bacterium]